MADMNLNQQNNIFYSPAQAGYEINSKIVFRSIGNVFAPVFYFLVKEEKAEENPFIDYSEAIAKQEMRNAETQRIMGVSKSKFNIVI